MFVAAVREGGNQIARAKEAITVPVTFAPGRRDISFVLARFEHVDQVGSALTEIQKKAFEGDKSASNVLVPEYRFIASDDQELAAATEC